MSDPASNLAHIFRRLRSAESARSKSGETTGGVRLLAVSKTRTAAEIRTLAALGQHAFGENYAQEAIAKQAELAGLDLEWHLIGHLQSNKARVAATAFDWVQSVDRIKLVAELARHRSSHKLPHKDVPMSRAQEAQERPPLNVLVQVNIDDEASKHGCRPDDAFALAEAIAAEPRLLLRGLMAIPAPDPDMQRRRDAFRALKQLFDGFRARYQGIDTLSMGMSEDFKLAIAEGATMVRIGTALFGERREKGSE
jgi:pyridoxal phosphate enzyme (YggS family)